VLGIDQQNQRFYEAHNYTPILSGFIKIGQMLVLQKAIRAVEQGRADEPLDVTNEMRERLMTLDCCTPFSWTIQLRTYGKKVHDSTTSLGYIQSSEDAQAVIGTSSCQSARFRHL